jgi:hypothetical protein
MGGQNFNSGRRQAWRRTARQPDACTISGQDVSPGSIPRESPAPLLEPLLPITKLAPLREVIILPTIRAVSPVQARFWRGYSLEGMDYAQ